MSKLGYQGTFKSGSQGVDLVLSLLRFKEDGLVFIYSPALDLTGYGHDGRAAKRSFQITLEEFVRHTVNKGTLAKELKRLGWKTGTGKGRTRYEEPELDALFQNRPYLSEIFRDKEFHRYAEEITLHAA